MEMRGNSCPSFFFKWSMNYHKQRDEKKTYRQVRGLSVPRARAETSRVSGSGGKKVETEHVIMQLRKKET